MEELQSKLDDLSKSEAESKLKLEKMSSDMSQKVDEGHEATKKNFDIHNLNTELEQKLAQKSE